MTKINTVITVGLCFVIYSCKTTVSHQDINVLPGQGIEIKGKSFLLNKTSFKQTLSFFNIKDTLLELSSTAMAYDSEGNSVPCIETSQKRVDHQNLSFYFTGRSLDSIKLNVIEIRLNGSLTVELDGKKIDNSYLQMPSKFRNSIRFPTNEEDIHRTLFQENESDFGITFCVDSVRNSIRLEKLLILRKTK